MGFIAGAVAGGVAVASPPVMADPLAADGTHPAVAVRTLQTMLMVAALTCDARKEYNEFIVKFRPALAEHGTALKRHFARQYGNGSNKRLNAFVTALANEMSMESSRDRPGFCARSQGLFASSRTFETARLGALAREFAGSGPEMARLAKN